MTSKRASERAAARAAAREAAMSAYVARVLATMPPPGPRAIADLELLLNPAGSFALANQDVKSQNVGDVNAGVTGVVATGGAG